MDERPTHDELIACVAREVRMRERVYPGWVARDRMTPAAAAREIATMKAVLDFLTAARPPGPPPRPPPQGDLFGRSPVAPPVDPDMPATAICRCGLSYSAHQGPAPSRLPEACSGFVLALAPPRA